MKRSTTKVLAAMLALTITGLTVAGPASMAGASAGPMNGVVAAGDDSGSVNSDTPLGAARRVLLFSIPTLTFRDMEQVDMPNLEALLEKGSVADLSTRTVYRTNKPGDGYGTLNAGTRTRGTALTSLAFVAGDARAKSSDGDPVTVPPGAFDPVTVDPEAEGDVISSPTDTVVDPSTIPPEASAENASTGTPAAEEFARRTGVTPPIDSVFNFGIVSMKSLNDRLLFDSEIGALGNALKGAGVSRAVIANGDQGPGLDDLGFRREASLALIDSDGIVEKGRVGRSLLQASAKAPFGAQFNLREVEGAFESFFVDNSVVLVESSDMIRSEEAKELSSPTRQAIQRRDALERSDLLLGRLLEHVDLSKDAVIVMSPYASGFDNGLTAFGIRSPGITPGLLVSGSTRRTGFIQTVDIAPTVLSLVGAKIPSSMEGTVIESVPDTRTLAERAEFLDDAYRAAVFRDATIGSVSAFFVIIQLVLWAGAIIAMTRGWEKLGALVQVTALAVLAFLPGTFLAGAFPFFRWGAFAYWAFVLGFSVAMALACHFACRRYLADPLMTMLGVIIAFLSADIITGGALQFNTVFGYTPTVAGRFDGMGNPAFSMFTASAIILAALIAYRVPGRRGLVMSIGLLIWVILVDGMPIWGADVGGALTLIPTLGITALLLIGIKVKWRTAVALMVGGAVAVTGLAMLDYMRPPTSRTHLGRLLANTRQNGFGAFETVILRKLNANLSVLASSVWTLMLPLVFLFVAFVFWRAPWRLRTISDQIPQERTAVIGLSVAMFLGFALNDSGIAVPGMMLGVINASLVYLMLRANSTEFHDLDLSGAAGGSVGQPGGEQSALT